MYRRVILHVLERGLRSRMHPWVRLVFYYSFLISFSSPAAWSSPQSSRGRSWYIIKRAVYGDVGFTTTSFFGYLHPREGKMRGKRAGLWVGLGSGRLLNCSPPLAHVVYDIMSSFSYLRSGGVEVMMPDQRLVEQERKRREVRSEGPPLNIREPMSDEEKAMSGPNYQAIAGQYMGSKTLIAIYYLCLANCSSRIMFQRRLHFLEILSLYLASIFPSGD